MNYDQALARMERMAWVVGGLGTACAAALQGLAGAAGFATGAALSLLNLRWLKRIASKAERRSAVFLSLRYLLIAAAIYVILRFTEVSLAAMLSGLLVAVAAAILEILYELVFSK